MQRPKGKLLALLAVFMALAMVTSTMAGLSGLSSDRTADVRVVSDYDAYLQMTPMDPGIEIDEETGEVSIVETEYEPIAYYDELGHLALRLDRVNSNSTSWFDTLFRLQNTQDEALCVWINDDLAENDFPGRVDWYADAHRDLPVDSEDDCVWLEEGESVIVGAKVTSHGIDGGTPGLPETGTQLLDLIKVEAESFKDADYTPGFQAVFAQNVLAFDQGTQKDGTPVVNKGDGVNRSDASNALFGPDGDFVSLGFGGELTVDFGGPIYNVVGDDGTVIEITFDRALYGDEQIEVYGTTGGGAQILLGTVTNKDDPFNLGGSTDDATKGTFRLPAHVNKLVSITLIDVSDPNQSEFPNNADAFDVDSIEAYDP
jgi:hypothetical protein